MLEEPELAATEHHRIFPWGTVLRTSFIVLVGLLAALAFGVAGRPVIDWTWNALYHAKNEPSAITGSVASWVAASALIGFLVGAGIGNLLLIWFGKLVGRWDKMESGDKVTLFLSVLVGLLGSTPFLFIGYALFSQQPALLIYFPVAAIILTAGISGLCFYVLQSFAELLPWNRGRTKSKRRGIKILDTNVIIDGRIYDVAKTGFLEGHLYVPGFVLDELQYIADSHDPLRRQRGRRGLEVLRHMQSDFQLEVRANDRLAPDIGDGVDARLVRLARAMGADIVTNDFNLNRVAVLQEVKVLNINDLALGLRPNVLPSETLTIAVIREGNQPQQGIGYLEDGTMVVVENGKPHIGETLDVTVSQVIQTERGKMIFAELGAEQTETIGHELPRRRVSSRRP